MGLWTNWLNGVAATRVAGPPCYWAAVLMRLDLVASGLEEPELRDARTRAQATSEVMWPGGGGAT
ncbi:MAG: hypothetical protein AB7V43_19930 [Acidimicrobiia bacterium]